MLSQLKNKDWVRMNPLVFRSNPTSSFCLTGIKSIKSSHSFSLCANTPCSGQSTEEGWGAEQTREHIKTGGKLHQQLSTPSCEKPPTPPVQRLPFWLLLWWGRGSGDMPGMHGGPCSSAVQQQTDSLRHSKWNQYFPVSRQTREEKKKTSPCWREVFSNVYCCENWDQQYSTWVTPLLNTC